MVESNAALNVKHAIIYSNEDWQKEDPYQILKTQEIKTTWHPIGV